MIKRTLIVIAVVMVVIFVPYWIGEYQLMITGSGVFISWAIGALITAVSGCIIATIYGICQIILDYIKTGKFKTGKL